MNIWEWIIETIKYLISTGLITAAIIYIGKIVVGKVFDGLVETYKYKLNTELEEFKSKQQKALNEYKIRYSRLHEDRAGIIVELYKKLVRIESRLEKFVQWNNMMRVDLTITPNINFDDLDPYFKEEYVKSMEQLPRDMFVDFFTFVHENDIFFTEDLVESLIKLNKLLSTISIFTNMSKDTFENGQLEYQVKKDNKSFNNLIEILKRIKDIKKELQKEFRYLLGVD